MMTVIAWDGQIIAADRLRCITDCAFPVTKLHFIEGCGVAFYGQTDMGLELLQWFRDGCDFGKWDKIKAGENDDLASLVVASPNEVKYTENRPVWHPVEAPFYAWGAGKDVALGALACGQTAIDAVMAAIDVNIYCGFGCDWIDLKTGKQGRIPDPKNRWWTEGKKGK